MVQIIFAWKDVPVSMWLCWASALSPCCTSSLFLSSLSFLKALLPLGNKRFFTQWLLGMSHQDSVAFASDAVCQVGRQQSWESNHSTWGGEAFFKKLSSLMGGDYFCWLVFSLPTICRAIKVQSRLMLKEMKHLKSCWNGTLCSFISKIYNESHKKRQVCLKRDKRGNDAFFLQSPISLRGMVLLWGLIL